MTEPANPQIPGPYELSYESATPYENAPLLVRLAGIFTLVAAGIDFLYAVGMVGFLIMMAVAFSRAPPGAIVAAGGGGAPGAPGAPGVLVAPPMAPPTPPPMALLYAMYGGMGAMSLAVACVKTVGAIKLLRRSRHAWGWGLAVGIVGCVQLWCSVGCVLPMAAGIYTIVIVCLDRVRMYLRIRPNTMAESGGGAQGIA